MLCSALTASVIGCWPTSFY